MQLLVSRSVLSHPHTRTNILLSCSSWNKCFAFSDLFSVFWFCFLSSSRRIGELGNRGIGESEEARRGWLKEFSFWAAKSNICSPKSIESSGIVVVRLGFHSFFFLSFIFTFFIFVSWLLLLGLAQNKTLNGAGKRVEACGFMQGTRDQIRNFHRGDKRVSIGHSRDRITRSHFAEVCN